MIGRRDITVNNAGITRDASMKNVTEQRFEGMIGAHLKAPGSASMRRSGVRWVRHPSR